MALFVALGTGLGAVSRVGVSVAIITLMGTPFPLGTLLVNITGSLVIGFIAALSAPDGRFLMSPSIRQFLLPGLCGGFTTFSLFSLETLHLLQEGRSSAAVLYGSLTLGLSMAAVWLGHAGGLRTNRLRLPDKGGITQESGRGDGQSDGRK